MTSGLARESALVTKNAECLASAGATRFAQSPRRPGRAPAQQPARADRRHVVICSSKRWLRCAVGTGPPSITYSVPVMEAARGEAKNAKRSAAMTTVRGLVTVITGF